MPKTYSAIVILAPGIEKSVGGPFTFQNANGEALSYKITGDPCEFRFRAARKIYVEGISSIFLLVGGTVDKEEKTPKAEVMRHRLHNEYGIPLNNLVPLVNTSNTQGNAWAVLQYLADKNHLFIEKIGLLTNFYHLARATRIFIEETNLRLIPIAAEAIVYDDNHENIISFYRGKKGDEVSEAVEYMLKENKDSGSEIKGLRDIDFGSYKSDKKY